MSQTPVTVSYSLEEDAMSEETSDISAVREVLGQINQKLDDLHKDVSDFRTETKVAIKEIKGEIKTLDAKLSGEIKTLEAEVKGISKRLDTQEFINRSVIVGFVLAVGAGAVKLFFPNFPS